MRAITRIWNYIRAMRRARRNHTDLFGWLIRRPLLLLSTLFQESMLMLSNRLDPHLKELAELKTAALVNCEFCLDIGSTLAHYSGITEAQVADLPKYQDSDAYNDLEKLVLAYAEAMTLTPTTLELEELRTRLLTRISKSQLAELAATIAWENQRARLNQALGVRPTGMAEGMACALPEPRRA
ncbi:carboxymuconolactone decarboxylase family protein [Nocardia sp. ET3-3]|uniref:Carboxymuconolactone decarboxylase family protein n=1 Tax=Nocardia terrae TaxID=2675851 RepID=A0A7K1V7C6_9NOCA|nr:carboxymuconolactone decarboxylase family protein [Nocardia terrae]MVU82550.1 carboxymuconolactone decarboxylase family protein [Nocardia terrae]